MPSKNHRFVAVSIAVLAAALLRPSPARAVVSPSGVNWANHRVLALESDDIGNGEFNQSCLFSTQYGLNVPWTGAQWTRVADAFRGHTDALGIQVPLTLYVVAAFMEPDFTPVTTSSSQVFSESFSGSLPLWSTVGSQQPVITSTQYVSPVVSAYFNTSAATADGYARRYINEAKEYEISFWFRLESVQARTHLVSLTGSMGRAMGIEAQAQGGRLMLREALYNTEILTPIGNYQVGVWRKILFRQVGGRTVVDLDADGTPELDKPTQFLPAFGNTVLLGDPSTTIYSGAGWIDDLLVTRFDNTYPALPRVTPIDQKFPDVVAAINADPTIYRVLSHGLTHGNDAEVQRRYAGGAIADRGEDESDWWREDYDRVNNRAWGVLAQVDRLTQAFDILERNFGTRATVHVSPGNVYGPDTDAALAMCGAGYHETLTSGAGAVSTYDPSIFWSVRTTERELFYHSSDPNPLYSAYLASHQVDSLVTLGYPVVMQTHAFNALVQGGTGEALATFYHVLLDSIAHRHADLVALTMDEMSSLERDGWSVSIPRGTEIYARNYLPTTHTFHVPLPDSMTAVDVRRLPAGAHPPFSVASGEVVFPADEGDYAVDLAPLPRTGVAGAGAPGATVASRRFVAWPNPSTGPIAFSGDLPVAGPAVLDIIDLQGRRVLELSRPDAPRGPARFEWDGRGQDGHPAAPGVYVARLRWTGGDAQAKILLVP